MSNQTTSLMSWKTCSSWKLSPRFLLFLEWEDVFNLSVQSTSMKSIVKSWWRNPGTSVFALKYSYVFVQRYISGSRCWRAFVHVNIQGQMRSMLDSWGSWFRFWNLCSKTIYAASKECFGPVEEETPTKVTQATSDLHRAREAGVWKQQIFP